MVTREAAEAKLLEISSSVHQGPQIFYAIDRSEATGAWRVIEYREGYFRKVVAS